MDSVTSRFDAIAICTRYQEANWRFHEQTRIKWITISSGHTSRHTRKTCRAEEWNIPYLTTNALICNTPGYLKGVTAQSGSLFYLAFNVLLGSYHSESELEPRNEGGWKKDSILPCIAGPRSVISVGFALLKRRGLCCIVHIVF